jgi:hypothetical protein
VNWYSVAAQFTTGSSTPQQEGMHLNDATFYNVNKCLLIDGTSSSGGSINMIDFAWSNGHCAASQGVPTR